MEDIRADEVCGGVWRTYELMQCSGIGGRGYDLMNFAGSWSVLGEGGGGSRCSVGWRCIKWLMAQHGGLEGVRADELCGSVGGGRTL